MLLLRSAVGMFLLGLLPSAFGATADQNYPNKPIRIVTQAVGSANDFVARLVAQGMTNAMGQQVIVDNRPVYVNLALIAASAPPDGYTLLSAGTTIWLLPLLQKMPFDPFRDFAPIAATAQSINVLVVNPAVPANSVKELIALAKAKPGVLNYASGGTGGIGHLTGELFKAMAGVNMVHVPYKGGSAALTDLIAGQVQLTFDNPSTMMPLVKAGKLRALAVTSAEPSILVPGLPTVAASGVPGFESTQMSGMFAPAKTSDAIIRRLSQEIQRNLSTADVKEQYFNKGIDVIFIGPRDFASTIKSDAAKWGKLIKEQNIKAD